MPVSNTVQVFGLPRAGTNFVEWCIVNYFNDVKYKNIYKPCNVRGLKRYRHQTEAYKHSYPSLDESDFAIVIYKERKKWIESYKRAYKHKLDESIWEEYLERANALDSDRTYIVEHAHMYYNLEEVLSEISEKFDLELTPGKHTPPDHRLNRGGANATPGKSDKFSI